MLYFLSLLFGVCQKRNQSSVKEMLNCVNFLKTKKQTAENQQFACFEVPSGFEPL